MADTQTNPQEVPPLPPRGRIVSDEALYLSQISLYRNTLAFGGQRNPAEMWATMMYNLPQAMLLYRELEDKDGDVSNALQTLRLKVLSRTPQLSPADESSKAAEVKDFVQAQLDGLPNFHSTLDCMLDAPGYGFSVQELIFDSSMGQASLIGINDCPQELFLFGNRNQPQIGQLQFLGQPWASEGTLVPEEKFAVFTYRMRSRNRMGRPLLKEVFWPSWFKRHLLRLWLQYAEKGPGTAVVKYPDSDDESEKRRAVQIAEALVTRTAIAVPETFDYDKDLLQIARSQNPQVYENSFRAMQYTIARIILGETLTSHGGEDGKGTQALGSVHEETLDARVIELAMAHAAVVNQSIVRPLVLWNCGPDAPMPKWGYDLGREEDLGKRVNVDSSLQKMGKQFDANYISKVYNVPLVEGENPGLPLQPSAAAAPADIPDPSGGDDAEFAEREAQAREEMAGFDALVRQLRGESAQILRRRTRQIAAGAVPVERQ